MKKIEKIALTRLYVEEHFQFMSDVDSILAKYQPQTTTRASVGVFGLYSRFKELLKQEDAIVASLRKNIHTRSVTEYDNIRDKVFLGMKSFFKAYTYNISIEKEEAAHRIMTIIENYKDPRKSPYNEETAIIYNMIQDLKNKCEDDMNLIGNAAMEWFNEMKTANKDFEKAMVDRYDDKMETADMEISKIRAEINEVYSQMTTLINIVNSLEENNTYINMAKKINERISYYKTTLAVRKGRADAKKEEEISD